MIKLLILADDFTGALDSGVQLSKLGAATHVVTNLDICFDTVDREIQVLVVDTETRHLSAEKARTIVRDISARAKAAGIPMIYKKTDSALRGNIGAELDGVLEGSAAETLYFIPAFPKLGRSTSDGIHYFEGVPIHETVFGKDPFEPVQDSFVPDIIKRQSDIPVTLVKTTQKAPYSGEGKSIVLFDAVSDDTLKSIALNFRKTQPTNVLAGCAGFAEYLPWILNLQCNVHPIQISAPGVLVVSGSLNPITARQLDTARSAGFAFVALTPELKMYGVPETKEGEKFLNKILRLFEKNKRVLVASINTETVINPSQVNDEVSQTVAANIGNLVSRLFAKGLNCTVVATGGDTLRGILDSMKCSDIIPLYEIETGVVMSTAQTADRCLSVVSKSGGFGSDEVFVHVAQFIDELSSDGNAKLEKPSSFEGFPERPLTQI
jgi:uncharacterized protein YgbK (DUF1537 family)